MEALLNLTLDWEARLIVMYLITESFRHGAVRNKTVSIFEVDWNHGWNVSDSNSKSVYKLRIEFVALMGRLVYAKKDSEMAVKILLSSWLVNELPTMGRARQRFIDSNLAIETRSSR